MGACSSNPAAVVANNTTVPPKSSKHVPASSILNKKGGGDANSREVKFTNSTEQNLGKILFVCHRIFAVGIYN